jgi:Domain of unknown function (DUF6438)
VASLGEHEVRVVVALVVAAMLNAACHLPQTGCESSDLPVTEPWPAIPADLSIELERTKCFGTCPSYLVRIDAAGEVTWDGRAYVESIGSQRGQIPVESVRDLLTRFELVEFATLHDRYAVTASDIPSARITLHRNGLTKCVSVRGADVLSWPVGILVWDDSQAEDSEQLPGVHVFDDVDREPPSPELIEEQNSQDRVKYGPTFFALDELARAIDRAAETSKWIGNAPRERRR